MINGREWLAHQMEAQHLSYTRADNCFLWIEDFQRAQQLAHQQLNTHWPKHLDRILYRVNPALRGILPTVNLEPYWSAEQTEWATDLAFRSASDLTLLQTRLTQHAMTHFQSPDVMRFLGRKTCRNGQPHARFQGEVVSHVATRPEGVCVKHRVGGNWIKMYNKQGSVLRVETTINDARDLKVFRPREGDPHGKLDIVNFAKGSPICAGAPNSASRPTNATSTAWLPRIRPHL